MTIEVTTPVELPHRPADGHKGTFGTVCVIGGQVAAPRVMIGGPAFSAIGALRSGAGLAVLAMPAPILADGLVVAPSATGLALPVDADGHLRPSAAASVLDARQHEFDCIAVGPGLGADEAQQKIVLRLLTQDMVPVIVDADAINALASMPSINDDVRAPAVLTPHPGEYRRLASALGIEADPVDPEHRVDAAGALAQRLGCVVVLKGRHTVVSDGLRWSVCDCGNVALATAGTGDVLTGLIAGCAAQFRRAGMDLFDCARLGVTVHGRAADAWAEQHGRAGMLATDLLDLVPDVIAAMRRG